MKFTSNTGTLLEQLMSQVGYATKTRARNALKKGMVRVNGETAKKGGTPLKAGTTVEVGSYLKEDESADPKPHNSLLYEDDHFLALLKPPGLPVKGSRRLTLIGDADGYIKANSEHTQRAFLLHVIDRDASGIVLFAKTFRAQKAFQEIWSYAALRYYAVVVGLWQNSNRVIRHGLKETKTGMVIPAKSGNPANLEVDVLNSSANYSLLRLHSPEPRKGQIRAQLAAEDQPVVGDKRFRALENPLGHLALHLFHIELNHPLQKGVIDIKTPVPRNFLALVKGRKLR